MGLDGAHAEEQPGGDCLHAQDQDAGFVGARQHARDGFQGAAGSQIDVQHHDIGRIDVDHLQRVAHAIGLAGEFDAVRSFRRGLPTPPEAGLLTASDDADVGVAGSGAIVVAAGKSRTKAGSWCIASQ